MIGGLFALRRRWQEIAVAALFACAFGWILWPYFAAAWNAPAAQRELVVLASELEPGMSQADVRALFVSRPREHLTLRDLDTTLTLVRTPHRFGDGEWLAWLDYTDGRMTSLRIRIADSRDSKPDGSPPDVGTPPAGRR